MKKIIISLLIPTLLLSCGDNSETTSEKDTSSVAVTTQQVSSGKDSPYLSTSGMVEAVNNAQLSTRMMGHVEKIYVATGEKVRKGTLLLRVNSAELSAKSAQANAMITEATAAYRNAEKDLQRFQSLFNDNSASQKELDDMRSRFEMAEARLEAARQMKNEVGAQFAYSNLRAPFAGVVTGIFTDEGDLANPGVPLVAVEAPGTFEVTTRVAENDIQKIKKDSKATVVIKALDTTLSATVSEVSTSAAISGGQFVVKAVLDDSVENLKSGMYATVQFPVEGNLTESPILIPLEAVVNRGQLRGIYTVSEQNTALLRWLRLGRTYGDQVEVLSGLDGDESFIVSAEGKLFNGVKVEIQ
ncbi:efflux RND transporter periplasmic adaptor subunit [Aureitalea sp. L0-47]|uniref:efflux RND transporter periplasmic adaptor subunit n=1 Tax=Aureitalea sp. L0-47 TaxID=2816962 RepID=UPI00223748EF|nr:efflux RND transporter periplasmic adaptor subunit [Aureitalea sp. L0-47]MCW5518830.1 efflux RND transporter periplasmic adaptor subunit [Aureitalea sp. L0-47]